MPKLGLTVCLLVAALMGVLSILAWPHMAEEVITRAADGRHGESSPGRGVTAILLPVTLALLALLVAVGQRFDPLSLDRLPVGSTPNRRNQRAMLNVLLSCLAVVLLVVHLGLLSLYTGGDFPMEGATVSAIGALIVGLGIAVPRLRSEGRYLNATAERFRAASSTAYRPAGFLLMLCGLVIVVLAWTVPSVAPWVAGVSIVGVVVFICLRGIVGTRSA